MYDERNWTDRKTWVREVEKSKEQQINIFAEIREKKCGEIFQLTRVYREVFTLNVRNSKTSLSSKLLQILDTYDSHLFFEAFECYRPYSVRPSKMSSTKTSFSHLFYDVSIMGLTKFFLSFLRYLALFFEVETLLRALRRFLWKSKQNILFF